VFRLVGLEVLLVEYCLPLAIVVEDVGVALMRSFFGVLVEVL